MALLDRIRKYTRVSVKHVEDENGVQPGGEGYIDTVGSVYDEELLMLIDAAKRDLVRVGVRPELVYPEKGDVNADVEQCIALYVKWNFGYDNNEADRFGISYRMAVCDLMNSPANVAAYEEEPSDPLE